VDEEIEQLAEQLRAAAGGAREEGEDAIPMLTEVVEVPRYDRAELPATLASVDWSQLALRVQENVLERLLNRSDALLEETLQSSLQAVIGRATESLAAELGPTQHQLIRDLVARAVTEELTRVHDEMLHARDSQAPNV
jgi:hypothetical protein